MPKKRPACQIHKKYDWIECAIPALPGDPEGLCILHSHDPDKNTFAFRTAILQIWNREDSEYHDFRGVYFPVRFDPDEFFGSREFSKPTDFSGATFSDQADFSGATFSDQADFSEATFTEPAEFTGTTFREGADFTGANFMQEAHFVRATFTADADFTGSTFKEGADFSEATFNVEAAFAWATFEKWALFYNATFWWAAIFKEASFEKVADFSEATFREEADFSEATFTKLANFNEAKIAGRLLFEKINPEKEGEPPPPPFIADFWDLQFQDQGLLLFQDLSLAQVRFAGTDLRRVEFQHVAWHRDYRGRQVIYDEILLMKEKKEKPWFWQWFRSSYLPWLALYWPYTRHPVNPWGDKHAEVERLYRDLQINYESVNDYKTSGDFHYGEMEMYRRPRTWHWFPLYWYNLYWALSGYGERPFQALCWLAGLLVLLPLLIWLLGLDISAQGKAPGFLDTFSYMFEKATFQKPELKEINDLGKFISNLGLLIIPGQAALFLLALRNRLGRRR